MARPEPLLHVGVIGTPLVLVKDHEGNRRAGSLAVEHAAQNLDLVLLVPGSGHLALPWAPPVQKSLDVGFGKGYAGRATVQNGPYGRTMGFAPGRDRKNLTKSARHAQNIDKKR